ncbi:hypothetical protein HOY80DRAFT_1141801 [Tuber brumale]|nr:hypothetical protein HOY80DRAFT_1141801 [Tuber brumale]
MTFVQELYKQNPPDREVLGHRNRHANGLQAIACARSTIREDHIEDLGKAFPSPTAKNAVGFSNPPIEEEPPAVNTPYMNQEQCPMFPSGPTDGTNRKDYRLFSQLYDIKILSTHMLPSVRGNGRHTDINNKINPAIADFGITPLDWRTRMPIQSLYTMQLRNYRLALPPPIILPLIKLDSPIILDLHTATGSIEPWVVSKILRKLQYRDTWKRGWGNLWALGAKAPTGRNIKIVGGSRKTMSKFVAIKDPHGDGKQAKEAKKAARL